MHRAGHVAEASGYSATSITKDHGICPGGRWKRGVWPVSNILGVRTRLSMYRKNCQKKAPLSEVQSLHRWQEYCDGAAGHQQALVDVSPLRPSRTGLQAECGDMNLALEPQTSVNVAAAACNLPVRLLK